MRDTMGGLDTFDIGYDAAKAEYIPELQAKYDSELQNLRDELSATKEKLGIEIERHAQLQSRCFDGGGSQSVFDRVVELEKRIRESQEQEPTVFVFPSIQDGYYNISNRGGAGQIPLYTMPPISPELAELQREMGDREARLTAEYVKELEAFRLENAELRKQLEERERWQLFQLSQQKRC